MKYIENDLQQEIPLATQKVLFCWSGGKDSALALHEIINSGSHSVVVLLTTVTEDYDRISMHGVRIALLEQQAKALNLPLKKVFIIKNSSNEDYEAKMTQVLTHFKEGGINSVVFGDIFLEDIRKYRENNLAKLKMNAIFPLWKKDSRQLANSFIDLGFKAVITCVDTKFLDASFAGREFDKALLSDLPSSVNPCGENGEFHTFVYAGPIFNREIPVTRGEIVLRDERFCFCDLIPESKN
ncbi:MAG: diphthine--ammonia ligase [Actinobacteria bacterium]|nr:diphthine--ammonia ligase [Actinomycetota bacterium]